MNYCKLGKNGPEVSVLGLGCMGLSEFYGPTDETTAIHVIHNAFQKGITFFDTADMYGKGANEILLGKAIKKFRDQIVIATKCGLEYVGDDMRINNSKSYIKNACEGSLQRLNVDVIDVYFLHRQNPQVAIEDSMETMLELLEEGKIRYIGLSEVSGETLKRAHEILGKHLVALQSEYSILNYRTAELVLSECRSLGIAFVAFCPLARGLLSGKIRDSKQFEESAVFDFRSIAPQFHEEALQQNLQLVDVLEKMAKQKNCTLAQLSLAWLLAQGNDIIPIPGTKRMDYLEENLGALDVNFSQQDLDTIRSFMKQFPVQGSRLPESLKDFNWQL